MNAKINRKQSLHIMCRYKKGSFFVFFCLLGGNVFGCIHTWFSPLHSPVWNCSETTPLAGTLFACLLRTSLLGCIDTSTKILDSFQLILSKLIEAVVNMPWSFLSQVKVQNCHYTTYFVQCTDICSRKNTLNMILLPPFVGLFWCCWPLFTVFW